MYSTQNVIPVDGKIIWNARKVRNVLCLVLRVLTFFLDAVENAPEVYF
jgi:hypothetical protein